MIVIGDQTETVDSRSVAIGRRFQIAKKPFVIFLDPEDVFALIASRSDLIRCIRILDSQRPRHEKRISRQ